MKKILSILMALMLIASLLCAMTACGGEDAPDEDIVENEENEDIIENEDSDEAEEDEEIGNESNAFPEILSGYEALPVEELDNTGWTLSGGITDGVEMEEEDVQAILDNNGGKMEFVFLEGSKVNVSNGEATVEGDYSIVSDGYILDMVFPEVEYYGVFTPVGDVTVLIVVSKTDSETALYFTQIDEM